MSLSKRKRRALDHAKIPTKNPGKKFNLSYKDEMSVMKKEAWSSGAFRSLKAAVETGGNKAQTEGEHQAHLFRTVSSRSLAVRMATH
jgi:hypothetical protein